MYAMNNRRNRRLNNLFSRFSTNLQFYRPELGGVVVCPLCLGIFERNAIETGNLTVEHIIPSSIGGRMTTITCKACNNIDGTKLDSQLPKRFNAEDIMTGKLDESLRGRIFVGSYEQTADVSLFKNGEFSVKIIGLPKQSDPKQIDGIIESLKSGEREIKFDFNLGYRAYLSNVAIIRACYLMMFRYFGYGYILLPYLDDVRKLIRRPEPDSPVLTGLIKWNDVPKSNVISFIKKPKELRCFSPILDLSTSTVRFYGMLFPGFDEAAKSFYRDLSANANMLKETLSPILDIIDYDQAFLTQPSYKSLPFRIWNGSIEVVEEKDSA